MTRPGPGAALRCERLKARRSKVPLVVGLGFLLAPIMSGLFMVILKDPERARDWGLITTKAQLFGGTADWAGFLDLLGQAVAIGGWILFSIVAAWVFGREFSDRTAKNLLAVPTPRRATVLAKLAVSAEVCAMMAGVATMVGVVIGAAIGLPGGAPAVLVGGIVRIGVAAGLTIALLPPVALVASAGRGYIAAFGVALLLLFLAQIAGATGWGEWFPWAVPSLLTGAAGPEAAVMGAASYVLIGAVSVAGIVATLVWWERADHTT
jgi:ABC-2 type transport system permease protein